MSNNQQNNNIPSAPSNDHKNPQQQPAMNRFVNIPSERIIVGDSADNLPKYHK